MGLFLGHEKNGKSKRDGCINGGKPPVFNGRRPNKTKPGPGGAKRQPANAAPALDAMRRRSRQKRPAAFKATQRSPAAKSIKKLIQKDTYQLFKKTISRIDTLIFIKICSAKAFNKTPSIHLANLQFSPMRTVFFIQQIHRQNP
jgi:hypothetical protein